MKNTTYNHKCYYLQLSHLQLHINCIPSWHLAVNMRWPITSLDFGIEVEPGWTCVFECTFTRTFDVHTTISHRVQAIVQSLNE